MITKDELLTYVKDPLLLRKVDEEQLLELAKAHPYFQTAHSLYSKKAALLNDPIKEHYIEKASAYSSDRKHLHFLHHNPAWSIANLTKPPLREIENKSPEVSKEKASDKTNKDPKVVPLDVKEEIPNIASNVYEASFQKLEAGLKEINEQKEEKETLLDKNKQSGQKKEVQKAEFNIDDHKDKSYSLNEWLGLMEKKGPKAPNPDLDVKIDDDDEDDMSFRLPKQDEVLSVLESINQNAKPQTAEDREEEFGIVTETLANILIKQGKLEKAIEVYHKLSLQNSEKNPYFEARIKELKKLL